MLDFKPIMNPHSLRSHLWRECKDGRELILTIIAMARAWCKLRFVPKGRDLGNGFLEEGGATLPLHSVPCFDMPGDS